MKQVNRACKKCKRITIEKNCAFHPEEKTTPDWLGFVIVTEPLNSTIAARAGVSEKGAYAIKVRQ
jgi:DNA-directed RNA polymerase subunit E"